jgi:DNA (cytosine-5)-methyltransferase 1
MKIVDLFSGCGGSSLGFEGAGLSVDAAFDWWGAAIAVYSENFAHPIFKQDLSDIDASVKIISSFRPDIIIGSPPCQDFSLAGKRVEGDRASLTVAYSKIIAKIKPMIFVMENVSGTQNSAAFETAERVFREAGYGLTMKVLNASLCGVPQKRKRLFCIGKLGECDEFLSSTLASRQSKSEMTVRDYLGNELGIDHYYVHPRNYSNRAIFSIDEPAPTIRGTNRPVAPGYKKHKKDFAELTGLRALTTEERARVQTFPSHFKFLGNKKDREQMIGNAVPVNLAKFVAKCIIEYESNL